MVFKPFRPPLLKKPGAAATSPPPPPPPPADSDRPAKRRRLSQDDGDGDDGADQEDEPIPFEDRRDQDDALDSFLDEAEGLPAAAAAARPPARPPRPKLSSSAFRKAHAPAKASDDAVSGVQQASSGEATAPVEIKTTDVYFNALWRKITNKKNKTWDGDGILVVHDGIARLQDLQGKEMARAKCDSAVEVGTMLSMHGKEVEVESVLPKADYLSGRSHLGKVAAKPAVKELEQQRRTDIRFNAAQPVHPPQSLNSNKLAVLPNAAPQQKIANAAFKTPLLNSTSTPLQASRNSDLAKPVPRHDPNKDGALVMPRLKKAPAGKQIVDVVVDPLISTYFRDHQRDGVKFMYECIMGMRNTGEGCILADEMGLGKTLQVIALIWTLLKQNPIHGDKPVVKKALIVCPATLIKNWRKEFRKWLGNERIGVFVVEDRARIRDFTHGKAYSVCIIGYEKLVKEQEQFQHGPGIDIVIADEGHRLKTATNKAAQAIKSLSTERRIVLSGTPLQNNLSEFYFTTDLVNPGILGKPGVFKRQFETPIVKGRQQDATPKEVELGAARYTELAELTSQFLLRRTADILAKYLPPKTEYVLFCKPTAAQAQVYRSILTSPSFSAVLKASETSLQLINVLKKVCNSPNLLRQREEAEEKDSVIKNVLSNIPSKLISTPGASGKLQVLDMLLHTIHTTTNEKVVLVSHYTATLDILGTLLAGLDYAFLRLDGSTPQSKRQGLVDKFNRTPPSECFAFLLSAKSGGAGLNLIGASRLILFDVDWNPSTDAQAMARIHRDGQTRPCRIYRLMTRGALDEKIYQRQITKQGLADSVVDSKKDGGSAFSREELQQLFRLDEQDHCQTHELLGCTCGGHGQLPSSAPSRASPVPEDAVDADTPLRTHVIDGAESDSGFASLDSDVDITSKANTPNAVPSFVKSSELGEDFDGTSVSGSDEKSLAETTGKKLQPKAQKPVQRSEGAKFASLLQFRHIDTALLLARQKSCRKSVDQRSPAGNEEAHADDDSKKASTAVATPAAAVIDDAVLMRVLRHAENRVSYIFSKTANGKPDAADSGEESDLGGEDEVEEVI